MIADRDSSGAGGAELGTPRTRIHARLSYDGTNFSGWARQPGRRTVQGEVEQALAIATRAPEPVQVVCAGRTDAGVHARDQHIHADLLHPPLDAPAASRLLRRLNGLLPEDVRVLALTQAAAGFDARFSVRTRSYSYRIADGRPVDPLLRSHVVGWPHVLDLAAMNAAADQLLGERDFAAFCRHRPEASTVRRLLELRWHRGDGDLAVLRVTADAFCHSMVRSLVGVLLPVGFGRREVAWPRLVADQGRRIPEVVVAPARGLVLERVEYADDLPGQARRARRVRGATGNPVG